MQAPERRKEINADSTGATNNHSPSDPQATPGIPEGSAHATVASPIGVQGVEGSREPEPDPERTLREVSPVHQGNSNTRSPTPEVGFSVFPASWLRAKARELDLLGISALLTHSQSEMLDLIWFYSWGQGRTSASPGGPKKITLLASWMNRSEHSSRICRSSIE